MSLLRLLIIEDEQSLLRSILGYFRREDFLCEGVETYQEGIHFWTIGESEDLARGLKAVIDKSNIKL